MHVSDEEWYGLPQEVDGKEHVSVEKIKNENKNEQNLKTKTKTKKNEKISEDVATKNYFNPPDGHT